MSDCINPNGECAQLYPADYRNALQAAARSKSIEVIDNLTDDLARMGLCRKRTEEGQFEHPVSEKGGDA